MNKISFKGATAIIEDFASRFLSDEGTGTKPGDALRSKYGEALDRIAKVRSIDPEDLENAVAFLAAHGVPGKLIARLLKERTDHLAGLAGDVALLRTYRETGTIKSVRVIEEQAAGEPAGLSE
jgi:hypothetical protein